MTEPLVYNCRSSSAWPMDLALTSTYFPHYNLNFAILFGCPVSVEQNVITRLNSATSEAAHPLLMPGILVELERTRHIGIIDRTISDIEARISDLKPEEIEAIPKAERDEENHKKRDQYLDTTYLRNQLASWTVELGEVLSHTKELANGVFSTQIPSVDSAWRPSPQAQGDPTPEDKRKHLQRVTSKIRDRVQDIIREYEDKIRDCTMRVDGMAMATQWVRPLAQQVSSLPLQYHLSDLTIICAGAR